MTNNNGFEQVKRQKKNFSVDKTKAIEIAGKAGLVETIPGKIDEFFFLENFRKQKYYNGQFRYNITDLVEQKEYRQGWDRPGVVYKYMDYVFNPWTGEFIEKKKMKAVREWEKLSGFSTGLIPGNE